MKITGIIHIGAHECEEIEFYEKIINRDKILWIEGLPDKVKISKERYQNVIIENAIVSDKYEVVKFNIANNGQSSSLLEFNTHLIHHPQVQYIDSFMCNTIKTIDVIKKYDIVFNFVNLDIQGCELMALKGMQEYLCNIDYIYLEVNIEHLYKDCPLLDEIDTYLEEHSFMRVEIKMTEFNWGDAFYIKL